MRVENLNGGSNRGSGGGFDPPDPRQFQPWFYTFTERLLCVCGQMSPLSMLQGKLCGLCGNNNYDSSDDMTTLDSKIMSSSHLFVMDNLLPSSYCDASDYETQLGLRHQGDQFILHHS